jgi:Gene product 88
MKSRSSPACSAASYAKAFLFRIQRGCHRRNYERSLEPGFPGGMIAEVRRVMAPVVRAHTSGDFYDAAYACRWADVGRSCP